MQAVVYPMHEASMGRGAVRGRTQEGHNVLRAAGAQQRDLLRKALLLARALVGQLLHGHHLHAVQQALVHLRRMRSPRSYGRVGYTSRVG